MDLHFDCVGGASGDMLLGALCDLHGSPELVASMPDRLGVQDVSVRTQRTRRGELSALQVMVTAEPQPSHRHLSQVVSLLQEARLPETVRRRAVSTFRRLAEAEAKVHGTTVEQVHFHEVGALDALVDVAGVCLLLHELGPGRVTAGPLPVARGQVTSAHGQIPLPAPAVLELLTAWRLEWIEEEGERVTPTGAALLATLAECALPASGKIMKVGCGAGSSQSLTRANIVRAMLIETAGSLPDTEPVTELVCVLDDCTGEDLAFALEILLGEGALDVYYAPRVMKKGRPGWELGVLCNPSDAARLAGTVLRYTSTSGVRRRDTARYTLPRAVRTLDTKFGPIRVKEFTLPGQMTRPAPEFEDCRQAAFKHGVTASEVRQEALNRWGESGRES